MEQAGRSGWSGTTHRWLSTATNCWRRCTRGRTPTHARPRSTCTPGRTGTQATSSPVGLDLGGIAAVTDGEPPPDSPVLNGRAIRVLPYEWSAQVFPYPASCCYHTGSAALAELSATQPVPSGVVNPASRPCTGLPPGHRDRQTLGYGSSWSRDARFYTRTKPMLCSLYRTRFRSSVEHDRGVRANHLNAEVI
jgi:hypothetical protein